MIRNMQVKIPILIDTHIDFHYAPGGGSKCPLPNPLLGLWDEKLLPLLEEQHPEHYRLAKACLNESAAFYNVLRDFLLSQDVLETTAMVRAAYDAVGAFGRYFVTHPDAVHMAYEECRDEELYLIVPVRVAVHSFVKEEHEYDLCFSYSEPFMDEAGNRSARMKDPYLMGNEPWPVYAEFLNSEDREWANSPETHRQHIECCHAEHEMVIRRHKNTEAAGELAKEFTRQYLLERKKKNEAGKN